MQKKDIVVGLGEIGLPIQKVLSKKSLTLGYDINPKLMDKKNLMNMASTKHHFFILQSL